MLEHALISKQSFGGRLASADGTASIFGGPMRGADKYLGAAVGDDGCVYAIPGSAKAVMKITPSRDRHAADAVCYIGDCRGDFVANSLAKKQFKWLRGVTAADPVHGAGAAIYGIPANAHAVLKIVPRTGEVTTLETFVTAQGGVGANPELRGRWKWHGAVVAPDGDIYCIPSNAARVLRIVTRTGECRLIGPELLPGVNQKWYGGLLGDDGCVYGMPYNADGVLKIVPGTDEVTTFGDLPLGGWKWHGGVKSAGGALYGTPSHGARVLKVVPATGEVRTIGSADIDSGPLFERHRRWQVGKYKYGGGVAGPDGCCYLFPYDALNVLKIVPSDDPDGDRVVALDVRDPASAADFRCHNKWQNGFVGRDGNIYAIPVSAPAILKIDPRTSEVSTVGRDVCGVGKEKWEGGVVHPADGALYCVPQESDVMLKIDPPAS